MKFQFDPQQPYQADAISSVTGLFAGQPANAPALVQQLLPSQEISPNGTDGSLFSTQTLETGAVANNLLVGRETILENLQGIQNTRGLEVADHFFGEGLDFDIEMETGTGKTYVYLRTAYELARLYGFTKYIILVPSVAIREGVKTSLDLMKDHFKGLYPEINMDSRVYSGDRAEEVREFATANSLQFLIATISSIQGDAATRIVHQTRDTLNGLRPLDFIQASNPIVIMDEPQNMESDLAQEAVANLNPLCTLRYSATHRTKRNLVYRLDPVDAHELGLVKQIVVSDAQEQGSSAKPYVRLVSVQRDPFKAKLELICKKRNGSYAKRKVTGKQGDDLFRLSGENLAYEGNWRINEISVSPPQIELTNHGFLAEGQEIGGNQEQLSREMIRETIREHIRKETMLQGQGIKVLSLFFIDKVASYLGAGRNNLDASGHFAQWFDELYREERAKNSRSHDFLPANPVEARSGYFAQMKNGKGFKDTLDTRSNEQDNDAYALIMRDKARLLDAREPVRFIFSHSALREGWDNPNVFQICTLRDMTSETERRQTLGRGLRLPVNQRGERVKDSSIAQLTVIANESYKQFAASLQEEYKRAGVSIGFVRKEEFAKLSFGESGEPLGTHRSTKIWESLQESGFIDQDGRVTDTFDPNQLGFKLNLPEEFSGLEDKVIDRISNCKIENFVKNKHKRKTRKLNNKKLYSTPEFENFWETISQRTTYRVTLNREDLISKCIASIKAEPKVEPIRIEVTRSKMEITRGGPKQSIQAQRTAQFDSAYPLPDIISHLQETTSLTRQTIIEILTGSGRLKEFLGNPNDFMSMVQTCIQNVLADALIEGIQYEKIGGSIYELRELQHDGKVEKDFFTNQIFYKVKKSGKTDYNYLVLDSETERDFAAYLEGLESIRFFMKLPDKFRIPTPVGDYNPDWAIIKVEEGEERLYLIRETKGTLDPLKLRSLEKAKIKAGQKHFEALELDYKPLAPRTNGTWSLE